MLKKSVILLFFVFVSGGAFSQVIYEHISNTAIYNFMDELANNKVIELNSVIKPYSRMFIAGKLLEAEQHKNLLNQRQKEELAFYLQGYQPEMKYPLSLHSDYIKKSTQWAGSLNPIGVFYKDRKNTLWVTPILGYEYGRNKNGNYRHSYGGLAFNAYLGKHLAFYTSLRDNTLTRNLMQPDYFIQEQGVPVKTFSATDIEFSEARGGITYSWKWGSIGLVKDNIEWGSNEYGANILSGRTPSFAMIKLHLTPVKWFSFDYFHAWLVSDVVDSTRSYYDGSSFRAVFRPRFMAANMFTFRPFRNFYASIGNSIVYSDIGVQAAYLIPFLFYKSVDHTLNATYHYGDAGQNSQMFMNVSSRNIKHLHLYGSVFVDELSVRNMFKKGKQRNFISVKAGARLTDFPIENTWIGIEYTRSNPLVYQNYFNAVLYESNSYSLGHYLRDNSDIINLGVGYKPLRGLEFSLNYDVARHGTDYNYQHLEDTPDLSSSGLPFMNQVIWKEQKLEFLVQYQIVNSTYFYFKYRYSNITGEQAALQKYTPEYYRGKTNTVSFGFNIGF